MKSLYIITVLASTVVATNQDTQDVEHVDIMEAMEAKAADFASLIKENCADMSPKCLEIAQDLHQTGPKKKQPNIFKDLAGLGACSSDFTKCMSKLQSFLDSSGAQ
ncbi:hypothetical protein PWT90_09110 [Aphanocladium album]|nr:hypothetical protein PWT90_09110 [Aphanocladium album]